MAWDGEYNQPLVQNIRWRILALLFFATTINYLDRILLGFLLPAIRQETQISDKQYGYITGAFQLAYTIGFLIAGKYIDRAGTRLGYAVALAWWSIAAALHAFSAGAWSLGGWRALLGIGEAGNFPAAIKGVAEWFPKKDRAFATGIFNAGSNVASMVGPPMFAAINEVYGWRACFLLTSSLGAVWLVLWLTMYRTPERHPAVGSEELAYIPSVRLPANVGLWDRQISYRSGVVVLSLLGATVSVRRARIRSETDRLVLARDLLDGGLWQRRRRMVERLFDRARLAEWQSAQDCHGDLRSGDATGGVIGVGRKPGAGDRAHQHRNGGAPRLVRESLHDSFRRVSENRDRVGYGDRRLLWRLRRSAIFRRDSGLYRYLLWLQADVPGVRLISLDRALFRTQVNGRYASA